MVTTIQLQEQTMEKLKQLKKIINAETYDDVIQQLLLKAKKRPSLAGYLGHNPELADKINKEIKEERRKSG
ncbi:MAG TPA: antitoxin VapB family protein [Candidatus Nanoarchaeia archaeon]|nr:antitoxin VapB family protein [Candidatus Nanoarchaeia archaeon]